MKERDAPSAGEPVIHLTRDEAQAIGAGTHGDPFSVLGIHPCGKGFLARTFIPDAPSGARFDRCVEFVDGRGRTVVRSRTTWAMIAQETGRIMRVPAEITARFFVD